MAIKPNEAPPSLHVYTAGEVAEVLHVGKGLIYELVRLRKIPHSRVGRYVRFTDENIREYLNTEKRSTVKR